MPEYFQLTIKNQLEELGRVQSGLEDFFHQHHLSSELAGEMMLVIEELLANTISYGYTDKLEHCIDIEMKLDGNLYTVTLVDDAMAFNPLEQQPPLLGQVAADSDIGGLGIPLIRALSDNQHYQRHDRQNVFNFSKKLSS